MATDDLIAYHDATISSVLRDHQRPTGQLIQVGRHSTFVKTKEYSGNLNILILPINVYLIYNLQI